METREGWGQKVSNMLLQSECISPILFLDYLGLAATWARPGVPAHGRALECSFQPKPFCDSRTLFKHKNKFFSVSGMFDKHKKTLNAFSPL